MSKPWILVSPASRGIGHALTRHLLRTTTAPILATARTDLPGVRASLLDSLFPSPPPPSHSHSQNKDASTRLHLLPLDVTSEPTISAASATAARLFPPSTHHLRLAFALPGILRPEKSPRDVDHDAALAMLQTNTLGPLMLMKWFGEFLPRRGTRVAGWGEVFSPPPPPTSSPSSSSSHGDAGGEGADAENTTATWLTASARVGSTSDNRLGGWFTYRASKSAVVSLTRTFDHHLRSRSGANAAAIAYHPGTVRTGLSEAFWERVGSDKLFSAEFAVERMVEVVRRRGGGGKEGEGDRGRCWDWKGEEVLP
ncbi:NAD(P)-binding protein [Hypoxylon fragiforme]|uniref:NAD(P)-binding protein n=1 Tax=Hypoxylon fragiforme TaxID=63214 RepID=UPI0020C72E08|nr:NAD(P)-binding protein [Hypoxylon fragiforme]KAI2605047.1 NAD(P)-binding protein [Hypoxylon fragiforme]